MGLEENDANCGSNWNTIGDIKLKPNETEEKFQQFLIKRKISDTNPEEIRKKTSFGKYTIPRKRKSEQKTPDVVGQGLASPYQGAVEKYPKLKPHSPSKHPKKISRKSARDFLSNEDDSYRFSAPKNDPLGLSTPMTYGEARGMSTMNVDLFFSIITK